MRKRTPPLEWHIVENDAEWERQLAQPVPTMTPLTGVRFYVQRYAVNVIVFLLLLVMVGAWWRTSQAGNQQKEASATVAAPPGLGGVAPRPNRAFDSVAPDQSNGDEQPLPQDGEQSLATPHFVYYFRRQDTAAVLAIAPQMDRLYTTLLGNFGLPLSPITEKLVITIKGAHRPGQIAPAFDTQQQITVPSPMFYPASVKVTNRELLAQSITPPLLHLVLAQAKERYRIQAAWHPLLNGFYLWQVWKTDLPVATWQETIVKWQYIDLPATKPGQMIPLPQRYQELCADYKLWLPSLARINFPLLCTGADWEARHWATWQGAPPLTHLAQLAVLSLGGTHASLMAPPLPATHPGQTVALATLVEYTAATYGRDRLPMLVAALGHYDHWETLLPAVFGVSAAEFEAGWQRYLVEHYGIATLE